MFGLHSRVRRSALVAATAGILALPALLVSAAVSTADAQQRVIIKGGQIGGAFNRWTSAWAVYLNDEMEGVEFSSESSTGSPENMRAVGSGSVELGLVFASDLYNGYRGNDPFDEPIKDVGTMTYVFASVGHFVVPENSDIKELADIKDKRISLGGPGSGSAANITLLLKQMGIWGSFDAVYLGGKSPQALRNGEIAAYNWHPGLGNATIRDTATMMDIRFVNLDKPAQASGFYEKYPYFGHMVIPGGLYAGVEEDTDTFGTGSILIANADTSADLVYNFLKAIYAEKGRKQLSGSVGAAAIERMSPDLAFNFMTVPLHPGAERYWKEQGKTIPDDLKSGM